MMGRQIRSMDAEALARLERSDVLSLYHSSWVAICLLTVLRRQRLRTVDSALGNKLSVRQTPKLEPDPLPKVYRR